MVSEKDKIKKALHTCAKASNDKDILTAAGELLSAMGYVSDRNVSHEINSGKFIGKFGKETADTEAKHYLAKSTKTLQILFQYTKDEINKQGSLLMNDQAFDAGNIKSFLFIAVKLASPTKKYSRSDYASMTREINKMFAMPVVVLFFKGERLTLSFIGRQKAKNNELRNVLKKVSLLS